MTTEEAKKKLVAMIKEWTAANPYMFIVGGEITNPETQRRSTHFNHVIIDEGCTNMGEELHYENLEEESFSQILEDLNWAISFGEYCHEEGGNLVHHWMDYGLENEAEAWEQFNKEHETPEGKAELNRLAWLRSIKEAIQ